MANIRKWIAQARTLEEVGDLQGALATFRKALVAQEETSGFADLSLYNGLGDLYLRFGMVEEAVEAFENAARQCEEQQLYANGIALCKKVLRNAPGHTPTYRRAARLFALSGLEAEARQHLREYASRLANQDPGDVREARREMVELVADEESAIELAEVLVVEGRTGRAMELLRTTRDRREREGRSVVHLIRKIQELQTRTTSDTSDEAGVRNDGGTALVDRQERPSDAGASDGPARDADPDEVEMSGAEATYEADTASLAQELERVLARFEGAERFRHALPLVEHLLEVHPNRFDLLHRKLAYAFVLGRESVAVEAYLALGECLDRHFGNFSLRTLSTSTPSGAVTAAIKVEPATEMAPGS